jgi:hypothetical protein
VEGEGREREIGGILEAGVVHREQLHQVETPSRREITSPRKIGEFAATGRILAAKGRKRYGNTAEAAACMRKLHAR